MNDETPDVDIPVRRVSMTVTGYLRHGHPVGGWYDMQTNADGGQHYSVPEFEVDELSVRDAAPEHLSEADWDEISGHVLARYGKQVGEELLAAWERAAEDVDAERSQAFQSARMPDPAAQLQARAEFFEATVKRVRQLAISWSSLNSMDAHHPAAWHEASRALHEVLDGPGDEDPQR